MLCGCCITILLWWWRWWCVCRPQCRHCNCIRLQYLNTCFFNTFLCCSKVNFVWRNSLTSYSLSHGSNGKWNIIILLFELSLCELSSEDRINLGNRGTLPSPNGSTALVGLGVLVEVSGSVRHIAHVTTALGEWSALRREREGLLYSICTRAPCFIMLIIKWIDT